MDKKTHSNVKLSAIKYIHGKVLTNKTKAISISIPKDSENKLYEHNCLEQQNRTQSWDMNS